MISSMNGSEIGIVCESAAKQEMWLEIAGSIRIQTKLID